MSTNTRDDTVDIAKGIGILFVVGGHCGFEIANLPAYSFHMPLFYFISGFFIFKYIYDKNITTCCFIKGKFKNLLIPYFIYNIIFGFLSYLIQFIGIKFNTGNFFDVLSVHNIFVEPFLSGHQYQISCPLWFVPSLFLVMIVVGLTKNVLLFAIENIYFIILLCILFIAIYYLCINVSYNENKYIAVICRTIIGYIFCVFGFIFYKYKSKINSIILLCFGITVYSYISIKFGNHAFSSINNDYGNGIKSNISLVLSLCGIFIVMSVSEFIKKYNRFVNLKDFVFLGKNSFHVMAVHLTGFVVLNIVLVLLSPNKHISDINNVYFRFPNINWVYFFFSVYFSWYFLKFFHLFKSKYWR